MSAFAATVIGVVVIFLSQAAVTWRSRSNPEWWCLRQPEVWWAVLAYVSLGAGFGFALGALVVKP